MKACAASRIALPVLLVVGVTFLGCGTAPAPVTVMGATVEPSGANCANGGQAISTGLDANANGVLDSDEVASTSYVCNGANGAKGDEGASCTVADNGDGSKTITCTDGTSVTVRDGMDGADGSACSVTDNGDGTKTITCSDGTSVTVSDGANGVDGQVSLIRLEDELPGSNCLVGGRKVLAGLDLDADGQLQDAEVTSSTFVCNACDTFPGSLDIATPAEWQTLVASGCRVIAGDLRIRSVATGSSPVEEVGGDLHIGSTLLSDLLGLEQLVVVRGNVEILVNSQLRNLSGLGALTEIGGNFFVFRNPVLRDFVGMGSLQTIGGDMSIQNNAALVGFTGLQSLRSIAGDLHVPAGAQLGANRDLASLSGLGALVSIGGDLEAGVASYAGLDSLESVSGTVAVSTSVIDFTGLQALRSVGGDLRIIAPGLTSLASLRSLTTVGGLLQISSRSLPDLTGLESLTSVGGDLTIAGNDVLLDLDGLAALTSVGANLGILENPRLADCLAHSLADRLRSQGWTGIATIGLNDAQAMCE